MSTITRFGRAAAAAVAGVAVAAAAAGAQLADGSFENGAASGAFTTYGAGQTFGSWTVATGSIDLILGAWNSHDGAQSVDLNGTTFGTIYQDVATSAGTTYDLAFWMSGNGSATKTLDVYWGGLGAPNLVGSFSWTGSGAWSYRNMEWQERTATGLAATSATTRLYFVSTGGSAFAGPALDLVSLTPVVSNVPEPGTWALLATGLLALGGVSARRKRAG